MNLKLPQPIHGFRARVGQVSGGAQRWSEPGALWQDVVRRLLRSATQTGCWGAEAPAVHVGAETTNSSVEVVQGDPLSARENSSWWDVCTRGMVSCTGFIVSCQSCFHCSIRLKLEFPRDAAWRLKGWRERRRWRPGFWAVAMRACKKWEVSSRAFLTSMDVWCSLRSAGGAIPERTGRYFTGVGRRQPLTIDYTCKNFVLHTVTLAAFFLEYFFTAKCMHQRWLANILN